MTEELKAPVFAGNDNDDKPRQAYADKVFAMSDAQLLAETERAIWLSAYAYNNPRSDYHWHVDVCYDVCQQRPGDIYEKAYKNVEKSIR